MKLPTNKMQSPILGTVSQSTPTKVGKILGELLTEHGFSAAYVSSVTGVPQPTITRIIAGRVKDPRSETLAPLARFFHLSVPQLRGEEPIVNVQIEDKEGSAIHAPPEILRLIAVWSRIPFSQRAPLLKYMKALTKTERREIIDDDVYVIDELGGAEGFTPDLFTMASPRYLDWESAQEQTNARRDTLKLRKSKDPA